MSAIRATWRNGQIVPDGPVDWPEGSRLLVEPDPTSADAIEGSEEGWSNTPEAIADWLKWCDSLQPLIFTPEEEAAAEAWLRKLNEYGSASMDKGIEDVFR
jgi:hypothetical protein